MKGGELKMNGNKSVIVALVFLGIGAVVGAVLSNEEHRERVLNAASDVKARASRIRRK